MGGSAHREIMTPSSARVDSSGGRTKILSQALSDPIDENPEQR
jgi:hypothetical protein